LHIDKIGWHMLLSLILDDIEAMKSNDEEMRSYMLDEIDEMFKGMAVNGQGIGIDFEEIRKAEEMYEDV